MKKSYILLLVLLILFFNSCSNDKVSTIEITFQPPTKGTIFISGDGPLYERKVDEDTKQIKDTLKLRHEGYYRLSYGQNSIPVYLETGDDLKIKLNAQSFPESTTFLGNNMEINSYLLEKQISENNNIFKLEEQGFLEEINVRKELLISKIENLPTTFRKTEHKEIVYEYYSDLIRYPRIHKNILNKQNFKVSDNYFNKIKNLTFNDTSAYQSSQTDSYPILTLTFYEWLAQKKLAQYNNSHTLAFLSEVNKDFPNGKAKDALFKSGLRLGLSLDDPIDEINDLVSQAVQDESFKKDINTNYTSLSKLSKGNPAPYFKFDNYNGDQVSLDEFKGKITYVDIWATWCNPCIAEIPALKELQKKFPNVNFVSISIDRKSNIGKWKKMIINKKLEDSYQLIAFQDEKFRNDYGIYGIPRFILIDEMGNLIDADAKRPSDSRLENQLLKLSKT